MTRSRTKIESRHLSPLSTPDYCAPVTTHTTAGTAQGSSVIRRSHFRAATLQLDLQPMAHGSNCEGAGELGKGGSGGRHTMEGEWRRREAGGQGLVDLQTVLFWGLCRRYPMGSPPSTLQLRPAPRFPHSPPFPISPWATRQTHRRKIHSHADAKFCVDLGHRVGIPVILGNIVSELGRNSALAVRVAVIQTDTSPRRKRVGQAPAR